MFWSQTHQFDIDNSLKFQNIVNKYFSAICGIGPEYDNAWNEMFNNYNNRMRELLLDIINYDILHNIFDNDDKDHISEMKFFYFPNI